MYLLIIYEPDWVCHCLNAEKIINSVSNLDSKDVYRNLIVFQYWKTFFFVCVAWNFLDIADERLKNSSGNYVKVPRRK